MKIPAPYGRHVKTGWGPILQNRTGWIIMESPSFLIPLIFLVMFQRRISSRVIMLFFILWVFHYFYRSLIYPFLIHDKKDMPLSIVLSGFFFNLINSSLNFYWLVFRGSYDSSYLSDARFIAGILLFATGFFIHVKSDNILRRLRNSRDSSYSIPSGFLFKYVSAPNYFGEILEWTGWAIATWSLAGLSFALWTCANLIPRALTHHSWYLRTFENYPRYRKAVIPYII